MAQTELKLLERELQVFFNIKAQLCERYQSGYVVINNRDILGIWDERETAIAKAIKRYGVKSFLVKNIKDEIYETGIIDHLSFYKATITAQPTQCYISPVEEIISHLLKSSQDFPLVNIKAAASKELAVSVMDTNILKKIGVPAWDVKKIKFDSECFLTPSYDITIRTYGHTKEELDLQVVSLDLNDEAFKAILAKDFC